MPGMGIGRYLLQAHQCTLCGQCMDNPLKEGAKEQAALFGAYAYTFCPNCKRAAHDSEDAEWREKVDAFLKEKNEKEEERMEKRKFLAIFEGQGQSTLLPPPHEACIVEAVSEERAQKEAKENPPDGNGLTLVWTPGLPDGDQVEWAFYCGFRVACDWIDKRENRRKLYLQLKKEFEPSE